MWMLRAYVPGAYSKRGGGVGENGEGRCGESGGEVELLNKNE
jgi:hypothetical protein